MESLLLLDEVRNTDDIHAPSDEASKVCFGF